MKIASSTLILAALVCAAPALAMEEHKVLTPNEVKWGAAPASIPKGAQAAAVYGDPSKEGLFALRLKMPAGYHIPPHTHPKPEVVTILSGSLRLGEGGTADKSKTKVLPAGHQAQAQPESRIATALVGAIEVPERKDFRVTRSDEIGWGGVFFLEWRQWRSRDLTL